MPKGKSNDASATGSVTSAASVIRTSTAMAPVVATAVPASVHVVTATPKPVTPTHTKGSLIRTSEAGMSTPVNNSLHRLDQIISPIAPVRSNDNFEVSSIPPPPPPVNASNSGVGNKYALNHSKAFAEEPKIEHLHIQPSVHTTRDIEHVHSVHVDVADDHALNHSRTFPEKHSPERVNPMRAARTAANATAAAPSSAHPTRTAGAPVVSASEEHSQPRSAIKNTERSTVSHTSSYPQAQLEVSFDRSVDSHSHSHQASRVTNSYYIPLKAANGRNDREDFDFSRNNHINGVKAEHASLRNTHTASSTSNHINNSIPTHANASSRPVASAESDYQEQEQERDPHAALRQAVRPVTARDLEESLEMLKYDLHREMQDIIKEQIRQFSIAKVMVLFLIFHVRLMCSLFGRSSPQHILWFHFQF